jgi:antitoxin MazE
MMNLQIAKWGNSLALRLPSAVVRQLGLREGDTLRGQMMADGALAIRPAGWSRASFAAELGEARASLPQGASVIERLRQDARY